MNTAADSHTTIDIFRLLATARREGHGAALVTVVGLEGSSARSIGSHMGVVDDGRVVGSFSGGCVEAAVVAEAQQTIASHQSRIVRFGSGSPYVDIRLPCGGGVDLLFQPDPPVDAIEGVAERLGRREPVTIELQTSRPGLTLDPDEPESPNAWRVRHTPRLKLLILGHGDESLALTRLAITFGAEVELLSPSAAIVTTATALGAKAEPLDRPASARIGADPWTAIVLLFHDHDWEPPLLTKALASPAFFIGAMGSASTHAGRLQRLREADVAADKLDRIHGPIGLIPTARDPSMLALSILAQVALEYRRVSG